MTEPINLKARKYGEIVYFLYKDGIIGDHQIHYALRIQKKLSHKVPLPEILKELEYVNDAQIKQTIIKYRQNIKIGNLLVELGHITGEQLDKAFMIQKEDARPRKLGEILVSRRFISEKLLFEILSIQMGFKYIDPQFQKIDLKLFQMVPSKWYETHKFIPIKKENGKIVIVFSDPLERSDIKAAREIFGNNIHCAIASLENIEICIRRMLMRRSGIAPKSDEESITEIVDTLFSEAVSERASDIHIEPLRDRIRIRLRRDGILGHHRDLPIALHPGICSRIKVMSQADITEKRRHQEGRICLVHEGNDLDMRVSFYVTIFGEKIVIRVLSQMGELLSIEEIGMSRRMRQRFVEEVLYAPSGVLIVTGPTGSGKTTTIYSCINHLNTPQTSIITAEEPVEYIIDGISQCSIDTKINLTFEETLRHIVRQDPDIIVVGEIRDSYSAEMSVQAALTGHKVLTTFHTEDSIGGLIRLLNMNIEAFLISSTVVCVLAQRLLRRICPECKTPHSLTPGEVRRLGYNHADLQGVEFWRGAGCKSCKYTGYRGRIATFEMLVLNEAVRDSILKNSSSYDIRKISIKTTGLVTLFEDGIFKAATGETTVSEVLRCLPKLIRPRPFHEIRRLQGEPGRKKETLP